MAIVPALRVIINHVFETGVLLLRKKKKKKKKGWNKEERNEA